MWTTTLVTASWTTYSRSSATGVSQIRVAGRIAFEDVSKVLLDESALPDNVDPLAHDLTQPGERARIARLLRAQSRFGAELDSLSDVSAFGVAPALIMFLWSLHEAPQFGWVASLALAVCCALRLARFNSRMDAEDQPHKLAGYLTGVPAPAGAGLAFVPVYLWLVTGNAIFRAWYVPMPWVIFIALLRYVESGIDQPLSA